MAIRRRKTVRIGLLLLVLVIVIVICVVLAQSLWIKKPLKSEAVTTTQMQTLQAATAHPPVTSPETSKENYSAEVSHDKAAEVKDEISLLEQVKITAILFKKLNADDLKLFQKMFDSGMTLEEKKKAKAVILQKLTEAEYDELIAIASKYGLSKGKSYEDSLLEQNKK